MDDKGAYRGRRCLSYMRNLNSRLALVLVVLFALLAVSAQAMPQSMYFMQDDYILDFGQTGNPLSGGTTIDAVGRIVLWNVETFAGSFVLSSVAGGPAVDLGNQWRMNFNQGTFKITSLPYGNGITLWEGTVDYFYVTGNNDNSKFSAAAYNRPAYETEPSEFNQVATARFTRTGGTWTDPAIGMEWGGTYNINYDATTLPESSMLIGNLQGKLVVVPEPGGLLAICSGLVGLVGVASRRRTR